MTEVIGLSKEFFEALAIESKKAEERTKELQSKSYHECARCKKPILNDDLWESRGRYYCGKCKTPKSAMVYVGRGMLASDIMQTFKGLVEEK